MARGAPPLVLAVDLGTSALKAGLCGPHGALEAHATVALAPVRMDGRGAAEADAREWLAALASAAATLGREAGLERVGAVVVSGHGPSLVAVDRRGQPLRPAMLWLDSRATAEAAEVARLWGRPIESWYFLPKALWLARNEPAVFEASAFLLSCPEFVGFHLTGTARTVLHTESFRHYYWREDLLGALGLDAGRFAPFAAVGESLGVVRAEARAELGLPEGVPVFAGGPDYLMSLIGTGAVVPGRICDRAGSSEGVNLCSASAMHDARLMCNPHIVKPLWNVSGTVAASGLAVEWARQTVGMAAKPFEAFFDALASVEPGAGGLVFAPSGGPARTGALVGLGLRHGPGEIARAVVEAVGFAMRDVLESMRARGLPMEHITMSGGQARIDAWNRIRADISGLRILVPSVVDAEIVGCAAVGFVALGLHATIAQAAEAMVKIARVFEPDPAAREAYGELHDRYRAAVASLATG